MEQSDTNRARLIPGAIIHWRHEAKPVVVIRSRNSLVYVGFPEEQRLVERHAALEAAVILEHALRIESPTQTTLALLSNVIPLHSRKQTK